MLSLHRRQFLHSLLGFWGSSALAAPWLPAFEGLQHEHGFIDLQVEGRLPKSLKGTLYRSGPMRFSSVDGQMYGHWFDGDGGVVGVRLDGTGNAQGAVRLIESTGLQRERKRGRRLFSGYGSGTRGAWWKILTNQFKNVSNTNVISWNDELWSMVESHGPTRIHPDTLETIGVANLDGQLRGGFSAHPHFVKDRLINIGMQFGMRSKLFLYELRPGSPAKRLVQVPNPHCPVLHDFALTEKHAVLIQPPIRIDFMTVFKNQGAVAPGMLWEPKKGTEIVIIPLDDPTNMKRFVVDPFYQWHIGNAWEDQSDIFVELVMYPDFQSNTALGQIPTGKPNTGGLNGQLTRIRIKPAAESIEKTILGEAYCEFPQVSSRHFGTRNPFSVVANFSDQQASFVGIHDRLSFIEHESGDWTSISFGPETYTGEAIIVPKSVGDKFKCWIAAMFFDGRTNRTGMAIIDADHFADGPVAKTWFPGPVPFTFHGHWSDRV